jgi:hypothetical protein
MTWLGTNSTNVAVAQGGAADLMWAIKSALLEAGWRLMSFGGGASSGVYQAPNVDGVTAVTDTLTTAASLNVNGAWFRIKEPGSTTAGREYVFQRGDGGTKMNVKYSRASGFTGSHATYAVGEQYSPSTDGGDEVSLFTAISDTGVRASDSLNTTYSSGRVHCVASGAVSPGGVWEFYALSTNGSSDPIIIYQAGLLPGTYASNDGDPSYRGVGKPKYFIEINRFVQSGADTGAGTYITDSRDIVSFWHAYGTAEEVYVDYARLGQYFSAFRCAWGTYNSNLNSIYDDKPALLPGGTVNATTHSATTKTRVVKGFTNEFKTFTGNHALGDTFNLDSESPYVTINTFYIGIAMPWVRNVTPEF